MAQNVLQIDGVVSNGGLDKVNTGTLALTNSGNTLLVPAVQLNAGNLAVANSGALGGPLSVGGTSGLRGLAGPVTISQPITVGSPFTVYGDQPVTLAGTVTASTSTTLALNVAGTPAAPGVVFSGTTALDLGANTLTVSTASVNASRVDGTVTGLGGLTKQGLGTLQLTQANSYAGTTTVAAGVLNVARADSLGPSTTAVQRFTIQGNPAAGNISEVQRLSFQAADLNSVSGTFTLRYGANPAQAQSVVWDPNPSALRTRIQTALNQIFGANTTSVALVSPANSTTEATFDITFIGTLGGTNLRPINLDIATLFGLSSDPGQQLATVVDGAGNEVQVIDLRNFDGQNASGTFLLRYLFDIAGQTAEVVYASDPVTLTGNIQVALNSIFGVGNARAWLISTNPDGSAREIEVTWSNTGLFAGVNLQPLSFGSRNEIQTITFSNISAATTGSFQITAPDGNFRIIDWTIDPNVMLSRIQTAMNELAGPGNTIVRIVSGSQGTGASSQYEIEFVGALGNQNLPPLTGTTPAFTVTDQLVNGTVSAATTVQGAGILFNGVAQGAAGLPTISTRANGVGTEMNRLQLSGLITGGSFGLRYAVDNSNGIFSNTQTISWNANPATLLTNIQNALNTMFGTGNTRVFLAQTTNPATFEINFGAGLSYANIDDLQAFNINLSVASGSAGVSMTTLAQGAGNEVQRISQTGNGPFALTFGGFSPGTQVAGNPTATTLQNYLNSITSASGFQGVPSGVTTLNGNTVVYGPQGGPWYVVFRNQLAFTDVPRFFPLPTVGTTVAVTNFVGNGPGTATPNPVEGPSFALTFNNQTTRPLSYKGRNTAPSAAEVEAALNDLPALAALGGPVSVTSTTDAAGLTTYTVTFARNEVQRLSFFGSPTGGTFRLSLDLPGGTVTTGDIAFSPTPAT